MLNENEMARYMRIVHTMSDAGIARTDEVMHVSEGDTPGGEFITTVMALETHEFYVFSTDYHHNGGSVRCVSGPSDALELPPLRSWHDDEKVPHNDSYYREVAKRAKVLKRDGMGHRDAIDVAFGLVESPDGNAPSNFEIARVSSHMRGA